jgi:two-component sensor histidine kinase
VQTVDRRDIVPYCRLVEHMTMTLNDEDSVVDIDEQTATRVALAVHEIVEYIIDYATSADAANVDKQV